MLAQLVVHFMADPVAGLAEMRRVARPGARVAACVWDHGGDGGPLSAFWRAARDLDPDAPDEQNMPGVREGHLAELGAAAGLADIEPSTLAVTVEFTSFDQWWEPFLLGVGRVGAYLASWTRPVSQPCVTTVRWSCRRRRSRSTRRPGVWWAGAERSTLVSRVIRL